MTIKHSSTTRISMLAVVVTAAIGCGGDPATTRPSDTDDNPMNQVSNNTMNNAATNNVATTPDGAIRLISPQDEVITNGVVDLQFEVSGEVSGLTLLVDGEPGASVQGPYRLEFDTSELAEGRHTLGVEYIVGDETRRADDLLSIVVDRGAPVLLGSLPADGAASVSVEAPISLTFSETLDAASIDSIRMTFGGQEMGTATLVSGTEIVIGYDRTALTPPYDVVIDYTGLRDAAGNEATGTIQWSLPEFTVESLGESIADPTWYSAGGAERVIGARQGTQPGLAAFERGSDGSWAEIASVDLPEVYEVEVATRGGDAFAAVLLSSATQTTQLRVYTMAAGETEFAFRGTRLYTADADADLAAAIAVGPTNIHVGVIDAVELNMDVFVLPPGELLSEATADLWPVYFNGTRSENLEIHADSLDQTYFAVARCTLPNIAAGCGQTELNMMRYSGAQWSAVGAPLLSADASNTSCETFIGFDAMVENDVPYLSRSMRPTCRVNSGSSAEVYEVVGSSWEATFAGDMVGAMMSAPEAVYRGSIAPRPAGGVYVAFSAPETLFVSGFHRAEIEEVGLMSGGFDTAGQRFEDTSLALGPNGPVVATVFDGATRIIRSNQ